MRYQEPDDNWMGTAHWSLLDERPAKGEVYPGPFHYFSLVGLLSFLQASVRTVHRIESVCLCSQLGVPTTISHAAFCRQAPPWMCVHLCERGRGSQKSMSSVFLYHLFFFFLCQGLLLKLKHWFWRPTDSCFFLPSTGFTGVCQHTPSFQCRLWGSKFRPSGLLSRRIANQAVTPPFEDFIC